MVDYDRVHTRRSHPSASISPLQAAQPMRGDMDLSLSPPRPTPSSRMSLSALVNSPPNSPPRAAPSSRPHRESIRSASTHYAYPSSSTATYDAPYASHSRSDYYGVPPDVGRSYLHRPEAKGHTRSTFERSASYDRRASYDHSALVDRGYDGDYDERALHSRRERTSRAGPSSYNFHSPSPPPRAAPAFQPYEPTFHSPRDSRAGSPGPSSSIGSERGQSTEPHAIMQDMEPPPVTRKGAWRPDDSLNANEEIWQEHLRRFQQRREYEAASILTWTPAMGNGKPEPPVKVPVKRRGWPKDHPTRIAQREAKAAAIAAGVPIPKKKYNRKPKPSAATSAAIDDELLGLAEGDDIKPSSPIPASSVIDDDGEMVISDPNGIIMPSGLTRAEVMVKVEAGDMTGLTEDDVKQVQDEMWLRKSGPPQLRKDGTLRKKPGPAKGWKAMRKMKEKAARGDDDDSDVGSVLNGEADADIAALLDDDAPKRKPAKRRKKDIDVKPDFDDDMRSRFDEEEDELLPSDAENGDSPLARPKPKRRSGKTKEPGVGKGNWTRPTKDSKQLNRKAEAIALQTALEAAGDTDGGEGAFDVVDVPNARLFQHQPNTYDPRGVSEPEARVRLELVNELQRQAWTTICRDIPKIYRVNQAYDNVVKQDLLRTAQACQRNAFGQRNLKTHRSKMNKDAATKAKKVMREMLVYWKKNEKDELAARKRAEKEQLEKAKAEEEAREAKRQSRKLNFLLTQTELYSHFIGKKIKTHEAEDMGDEGAAPVAPLAPQGAELELDESGEPLPELDYDEDDDDNMRRHAARSAQEHIKAAKDKAAAFDQSRAGQTNGELADLDMDGDELNFQNPTMGENQITITQPNMLMAQLKEYQLKGLTWLGNLYEQGINGILADEMGLGKTIQSISLLAYLAEVHGIWGPFLIIAPASTLHNWQQELARFVPRLKTIPYWGGPKDRETLRRIWNRKNQTFTEDSPFHIVVTSYQLAVQDEKYFQMMRWQYMILDEAQAIKSSTSARWKSLLSFNCRNRLLLTGTPIQNSMHELWALLHFIMPSLFDSHEEFSEWFSKDIENAASGGNASLKPEQLKRLHMILKPFMLRRVKKHVQKELGDKIEIDVLVDLSQRQRELYRALRKRVPIGELIAQANNSSDSASTKHLMNLVMQFRKVCSHPDLFERQDVMSPVAFGTFSQSGNLAREVDLYCPHSIRNPIEVQLPRLIWEEGKLDVPSASSQAGNQSHVLHNLMNIWKTDWISDSLKEDNSEFAFLRVTGVPAGEANRQATGHPLVTMLEGASAARSDVVRGPFLSDRDFAASSAKRLTPVAPRIPDAAPDNSELPALRDITRRVWNQSFLSRADARLPTDRVVAKAIVPIVSNRRSFVNTQERLAADPVVHAALYGVAESERDNVKAVQGLQSIVPGIPAHGLLGAASADQSPVSTLRFPSMKRFIVDSAKLARLDDLLRELKEGGHRVLLYFQMTRTLDLVQEFLISRRHKYLRLDGSTPIGERRDMVTAWQTNPDIFVFCLSTRAGGLGINLTAADTCIFFEHDWNPSNDAQAMDRAHRVGQTKQVTVYRLISRGTIDERIVQLSRAKKDVQDIVVGNKGIGDMAKPTEIASLFMDDEELAESVAKRKQAEAHGYTASAFGQERKSAFGDDLRIDEDEGDDFFSAKRQVANDDDDEAPSGARTPVPSKKRGKKDGPKPPRKKVKIALGPDGLPI
ncbi:hypothetical protein CspHIS471_0705490 [Cutaneotrichosporon sp. HIS471]|nr:hypothetical protein CspHIS471_0705490 [Cutaneotrichosporon sp. HIS471]